MNELILHPRMRYGTYIISLFDLWRFIRTELSHHVRHTADLHHGHTQVDQDTDRLLVELVQQSQYLEGHDHDPLRAVVNTLTHPSGHYDYTEGAVHQLLTESMRRYFNHLSEHLPWLVVAPGIRVDLSIRNRFDLIMVVGPDDRPRLR